MKVRDVVKVIVGDGWYLVTTKGSHRQYKHPTKTGRVTIAVTPATVSPRVHSTVFSNKPK
jgi:predicted RNA binding protein YcfA (HicA-like mRNA interferase family)